MVLPSGQLVPAGRPLLPEERRFLFYEECFRTILDGNFEALSALPCLVIL